MKDSYWRPISIDSIDPEYFPLIPLFLKSSGNYVLYKDAERPFTSEDRRRLERSFTEFVYVRSGDMLEINRYLESNLTKLLGRDDLNSTAKGKILYQSSVNCVIDMFESPESSAHIERCNSLIRHMMKFAATGSHILDAFHSIAGHNFYIFVHSVQVTALGMLVHEKLFNIEHDEMMDVGVGSMIHDYGMIFITDKILDKADPLSDIEYYKVKQHTRKGYEYLRDTGKFSEVALNIVHYHHERFDGAGYPSGLKKDDIPRSAQVASICDVYSALTLDRSYRKAVSHQDALKTMKQEAKAGAFNVELFNRFEELVTMMKGH